MIERKEDNERRKSEAELARLEAIRVKNEKFEAAKRGTLLSHARDLNHAQTLRRFVEDVLKQKGELIEDETKAWAWFVRDEADCLDPITDNRFLDVLKLRLEDFGENDG